MSCCEFVKRRKRDADLECFDGGRLFANEDRMVSLLDLCVKSDGIWWKVIETDGFSL